MHCQAMTEYGAPLVARDTATPQPSGREVLVRIHHCGVCHSDIHMHDGHFNLGNGRQFDVRAGRTLPFTLGHEIEGEIVAAGPQAEGAPPGARRVVYPWIGCGTCKTCLRGDEIFCDRPRHLGITVDGGYATHVLVPDARYLLDASGLDPALAGTYMCSGLTAYSALHKLAAEAQRGPVLIVGLGGVGMMAVEFAKVLFPDAPLVADIDPVKRSEALARGAAIAYDPSDPGARKAIMADTGGVAGAVDLAGAEGSFTFANNALRKGGKLVIAGLIGGSFSMPIPMFPLRGITLQGSFVGTLDEAVAMLELVRSGIVKPIPIEKRPLSAANRSLDDLRKGGVVGRIVLTP